MAWLHPIFLWTLLLVPAAIILFLWAAWRRRDALLRLGDRSPVSKLVAVVSPRRRRWKAALVTLSVFLFGLALAGPRFGTKLREVKREGVDVLIALDVSLSMTAEDVAPTRLERAKNEIKKMLDDLRGDRVGLIIFAGDAFLQCPLTTDYNALRLFLDVADPTLIPTPGTDFGAALRMAMQAFEAPKENEREGGTKALLIVSDGENHVENIADIVSQARSEEIVIFAAGVGETTGGPIPVYQNGRRTSYKKDKDGHVVNTRLEEDALKSLASDGAYFRIARTSSSLSKIIASFERLEKAEFAKEEFEEYEEKYQWPLALAVMILFSERIVSDRRKRPRLRREVEEENDLS